MGQLEETGIRAVRASAKKEIKQIITGVAVNITETGFDLEREGHPTLFDVRLNAIEDEKESYLIIYPQTKSEVMVGIIENQETEGVLLQCSEIEKVKLKIGETTMDIDKTGIVFNGGQLDGMVQVVKMVEWMNKVYSDLQKLMALLAVIPVAPNSTGSLEGKVVFTPTTPLPTVTDFKNDKVKH